jgi:hypothetical protein
MLNLCTTTYALTGNKKYWDEAEYWAYAGMTFIYAVDPLPAEGAIGRFSSIAVLGATHWVAPTWIGMPVQWCGLVFRNSLLFYASQMKDIYWKEFWTKVASGITFTALQMNYPQSDNNYRGLLPDSYAFNPPQRNAPNINPGSLMIGFQEAFDRNSIFGKYVLQNGSVIYSLGGVSRSTVAGKAFSADIKLWPEEESQVLVSGVSSRPLRVSWQGRPIPFEWLTSHNVLLVSIKGGGRLEVE